MEKKNHKILCICICCVLLLCMYADVFALSQQGSIRLKATVDPDGTAYVLSDTEFVMYQVAAYKNSKWVLQSGFKDSGVEFDFEDASVQRTDAKLLKKHM